MKHSWTGGQYGVWRALVAVAVIAGNPAPSGSALSLATALLAVLFAAGARDRLAAALLALLWLAAGSGRVDPRSPESWGIAGLLLLHALTRGSPYGSFAALGRGDPGGSWILPRWNFGARWMLLAAAFAVDQASLGDQVVRTWMGESPTGERVLHLGGWIAPAALVPLVLNGRALRAWWIAALVLEVWECAHLSAAPWRHALVLLHLSTLDPGWLPPARASSPSRVFFDGACGLCRRLVRFAIAEDRPGSAFRFATLQGAAARARFGEAGGGRLQDSAVVVDPEGRVLVRSRATLHVLDRLGGLWRATAIALRIVPPFALDAAYDAAARARSRLFAPPGDPCPVSPPHLRERFDG